MELLAVVLILIVWAGAGIKESLTPKQPPIKDMDVYLMKMLKTDSIKDRRKLR